MGCYSPCGSVVFVPIVFVFPSVPLKGPSAARKCVVRLIIITIIIKVTVVIKRIIVKVFDVVGCRTLYINLLRILPVE